MSEHANYYRRKVTGLERQLSEMQSEIEKWKSIAGQITTDWIPANRKLSEELKELKDKIARYEQGVEVVGWLYDDYEYTGQSIRLSKSINIPAHAKQVRVLVMEAVCET